MTNTIPDGRGPGRAAAGGADRPGAAQWVPAHGDPARRDLAALARAAQDCRGCELFACATRTVFGSGPAAARLMLVGEQPGDQEDRAGEPFVGPAGRVLERALNAAGLGRGDIYLTNAVKHFRHTERGKRRLHRAPQAGHVNACRPWLSAELTAVQPELVVLLGATAGRAVHGPGFRVGPARGVVAPWPDQEIPARVLASIHPSAVLRADGSQELFGGLVADLTVAAEALA